VVRIFVIVAVAFFAAYLALGAYAGLRVAQGIDQVEHSSVLVRAGASVLGRRAIERIAIRRSGLPAWLVASPSFWIALRSSK